MNKKSHPLLEDTCLPFQIEGQDIKGRIVRLGHSVNEILSSHNYPNHISKLMGEVLAFTALIGSLMKYDGILTTQMKGDGPFRVLINDFHKENKKLNGNIRGYASFDDIMKEGDSLQNMFGEDAYLAITIDQGSFMERYQGIVKLEGDTFTHAAEEYFRSSEQLPTKIVLTCDQDEYGVWQACAIMIQHYARSAESEYLRDETKTKEDWNNSSILLSTIKKVELLDKKLSLQNLLIRLYHEAGLRVFDHTKVSANCRCSEDKIRTVLSSLNLKELKDVSEDGTVTVTCDFCKIDHKFELSKLIDQV